MQQPLGTSLPPHKISTRFRFSSEIPRSHVSGWVKGKTKYKRLPLLEALHSRAFITSLTVASTAREVDAVRSQYEKLQGDIPEVAKRKSQAPINHEHLQISQLIPFAPSASSSKQFLLLEKRLTRFFSPHRYIIPIFRAQSVITPNLQRKVLFYESTLSASASPEKPPYNG